MLETAMAAAEAAAKLLRQNFGARLNVNETTQRDIKLELDVQAQATITRVILGEFPEHAILGEEGVSGAHDAEVRWVIDPLDGTVNYFYNIPHYAVSIAAQQRVAADEWQTVAGVVLDPELDELFAAEAGKPPTLNGTPIRVSERATLPEAIVSIGFFKNEETVRRSLAIFQNVIRRVRKLRLQGAAALDVAYVACGRYDAYIEHGIRLWDIAAGQLILEQAGGKVISAPTPAPYSYDTCMWNGKLPVDELRPRPE